MKQNTKKNEGLEKESPEAEAARLKKKEKRRFLIVILINSILFYGVYAVLTQYSFWKLVAAVYMIALAVVSVGYVFYNRGFTRKNVTVEMLPDTWSEEEKQNYIEDGERRMKKSKWCLMLIFPLVFTFFMDIFYLYIYEPYFASTFENLFG